MLSWDNIQVDYAAVYSQLESVREPLLPNVCQATRLIRPLNEEINKLVWHCASLRADQVAVFADMAERITARAAERAKAEARCAEWDEILP